MESRSFRKTIIITCILAAGFFLIIINRLYNDRETTGQAGQRDSAPVEIGVIKRGPIELRRIFSGSLEPVAEFVIAPKVSGRVERVYADLGDIVEKGQVVAQMDNDEFLQSVALAEADLQVAKANLVEAENALEIAARELKRFDTLRSRGVASDSQFDGAKADQLSKQAAREVARARVNRAEALLETARIRLGYTEISASWADEGSSRIVSERFVDEGETVAANAPLLSIVSLDPMIGVIYVTEKDYASLKVGQMASLVTDAFADTRFKALIDRISPVFGRNSRQAKVELKIENNQGLLKPGMFIRVTIVLDRIENAVIVPEQALTSRDDKTGIFVVDNGGQTVSWRLVKTGILDSGMVQIDDRFLSDLKLPQKVVTLGQQLLNDGSVITISESVEKMNTGSRETPQ